MISSSIWSSRNCDPVVREQQDGQLQVWPTGMGGIVLIMSKQDWMRLASCVADYLAQDVELDRGKPGVEAR